MSEPTFGITGLTEAKAKELAQLLALAAKAERLNVMVQALVEAPISIATKANEYAALIQPEEPAND